MLTFNLVLLDIFIIYLLTFLSTVLLCRMHSGTNNPSNVDSFHHAALALQTSKLDYEEYIDAVRFSTMDTKGVATIVYDARNGINFGTEFGARTRRKMHRGKQGADLPRNDVLYVDEPFI